MSRMMPSPTTEFRYPCSTPIPAATSAERENDSDVDRELAQIMRVRNRHVDDVRDDEAGHEPKRRNRDDAGEHRRLLRQYGAKSAPIRFQSTRRFTLGFSG